MKSEPLISVIIPIYNGEKYLRDCLESVLNQSYSNMEIFLIDDGSTDGSGNICQKYTDRDSRFTYVKLEHLGVAAARNKGLELITGEYFFFLDCDDFLFPSTIEKLYKDILENDSDMSVSNTCTNKGHKIISYYKKNVKKTSDEVLSDALNRKYQFLSVWGVLFKTEVFSSLRFEAFRLCEDELFFQTAVLKAATVSFVSDSLYFYRNNENGAINSGDSDFFYDGYRAAMKMNSEIEKAKPQFADFSKVRLLSHTFFAYFKMRKINKSDDRIGGLIATIKKYRKLVLKNRKADKKLRMLCAGSYLGLGFMYCIYNLYLAVRK